MQDFQEYSSKLEILLSTEIGNGHCISVCNTNFFRKKSGKNILIKYLFIFITVNYGILVILNF